MWIEIVSPDHRIGRHYLPIFFLATLTVSCMAYGRHVYREGSVAEHRAKIALATADFQFLSQAAAAGQVVQPKAASLGEEVFRTTCGSCHAVDRQLVGPSLKEIASIYAGNPAGIVKWARNPGKKRPGLPPMPSFAFLSAERLEAVAGYMLEVGAAKPHASSNNTQSTSSD